MLTNLKDHWEHTYRTKKPHELSWNQEIPGISLSFIHELHLPRSARIIDIGGGDSKLADHLMEEGFTDVTVVDISEAAVERARMRLGDKADRVRWIVSNILDFVPEGSYDLWHDRAAFHFLRTPGEISAYLDIARTAVRGSLIIGTFSPDGPAKCSGLDVQRYDEEGLKQLFTGHGFRPIDCRREDHVTPSGGVQNFVFCSFMHQ